jgi:hypothetical protein
MGGLFMIRLIATLSLFMCISFHQAFGDFLVEPKLGIDIANEVKSRGGRIENESSRMLYGYSWGGRLGYAFTSLQLGFELGESDLTGDEDDKDASDTGEVKIYEQGYFVAYQMDMLRFWISRITYAFVDGRSEFTGTGYKLGAGSFLSENLAVNLEYASRAFSRETIGSVLTIDDTIQSIVFSVSLPFVF